jgi:hypothetical protein
MIWHGSFCEPWSFENYTYRENSASREKGVLKDFKLENNLF